MTGRSFRRGVTLGILGGAAVTAVRLFQDRRPVPVAAPAPAPAEWPPIAVEPEPEPAPEPVPPAPWVDPLEDGSCPSSHPIKGKLGSGLFHVPGGFNYPRTRAERCYLDLAAAESDGLRQSKR